MTATEGPGVTNLATGIAAAYKGLVPVISICGVQESLMRERDATQDIDQTTFMRPITKWAYTIPTADKVQECVRSAFRVALTEPQGPTHIDASSEILLEQTAVEAIAPEAYRNTHLPACAATSSTGAALLAAAERPVFVVGRGVISEKATAAMAQLAEATGIPVAALQYSPDAFPRPSRWRWGRSAATASAAPTASCRKADLIIAIGAHIDVFSTMLKYGVFSAQGEARASQRGAGSDRHRFPRHARRDRLDAELHRRASPSVHPRRSCASHGWMCQSARRVGGRNCRAW